MAICFLILFFFLVRLATRGRLVTIGFITGYQSKLGFPPVKNATLVPKVTESTDTRNVSLI